MSLSFENYDSSIFPTFPESIAHSRSNPFLIENLSNNLSMQFDNDTVLMQEPSCLFKDLINFFEEDYIEIDLPVQEHYRPEITAKRLYGSSDFWYIILLVNNIFSVNDYNMTKVRYIPNARLTKMQTFIKYSKGVTSIYKEQPIIESFL